MRLGKYSLGIGDRFGLEGAAQLAALQQAAAEGVEVTPVWNKSNREHSIIGTTPEESRRSAERAVKTAGWDRPFYLDADHIGLRTVDRYLPFCDFYTIDVAEVIGRAVTPEDHLAVRRSLQPLVGRSFPALGLERPLGADTVDRFLTHHASAIREAGRIYRHIEAARGKDRFIAEVSTDEAETPQSPLELFLILGALAGEGVRVQTIAPKFTGRFNKGVDYVGDVGRFTAEFERDLASIRIAVAEFDLPENLKISVHSGSDKFSIYGPIRELIRSHDAGLHLKTAGTTWLEEVIGLALSGGSGLAVAREIYARAFGRIEELSGPYAAVIDIDRTKLPNPAEVVDWDGASLAAALTHDQSDPRYNPNMRQLVHVGFRVAAEMGQAYLDAVEEARSTVEPCVTRNLYDRHIRPLFVG